jgi:hypothetical protein
MEGDTMTSWRERMRVSAISVTASAVGVAIVIMPAAFVALGVVDATHLNWLGVALQLGAWGAAYLGAPALVLKSFPSRDVHVSSSPLIVASCSALFVLLQAGIVIGIAPPDRRSVGRAAIILAYSLPVGAIVGAMVGTFIGAKSIEGRAG